LSPRLLRRVALGLSGAFIWSALAPSAWAITHQPPRPQGHIRTLTASEMARITGANTIGQHALSEDPDSGGAYAWEGTYGGTNTGNGNKLTDIPLLGWTARGRVGEAGVSRCQTAFGGELPRFR
jgi:hypothetical protein